jgi:hypothetical protein
MAEPVSPEDIAALIADALHQARLLPDSEEKFRFAVAVIADEIYARLAGGEYIPPIEMHANPGDTVFTPITPLRQDS